jgi:hypothetical protein
LPRRIIARWATMTASAQLGQDALVKIYGLANGIARHVLKHDRLRAQDRGDDFGLVHC